MSVAYPMPLALGSDGDLVQDQRWCVRFMLLVSQSQLRAVPAGAQGQAHFGLTPVEMQVVPAPGNRRIPIRLTVQINQEVEMTHPMSDLAGSTPGVMPKASVSNRSFNGLCSTAPSSRPRKITQAYWTSRAPGPGGSMPRVAIPEGFQLTDRHAVSSLANGLQRSNYGLVRQRSLPDRHPCAAPPSRVSP